MRCKCYLQLGSYSLDTDSADCMDVSQMIRNLDSIKVSYSRVDLGGVVRKCGSSLEFTGKARDAILAHYAENYLQSKGVFAVYLPDNNWVYSKAWECPLDFATLQYDANMATIGCVDNSVAAIIKANKKSKYEFDVTTLKDASNLSYNGVVTRRSFTFTVTGATPLGETTTDMVSSRNIEMTTKGYYSLYLPYIGVSADDFGSEQITCHDQQEGAAWSSKDDGKLMKSIMDNDQAGFVTCITDATVHIDMDVRFRSIYSEWWRSMGYLLKAYFILVIGETVVWRKEFTDYTGTDVSIHGDFSMYAGQKMAFGLSVLSQNTGNTWRGYRKPDGSVNNQNHLIFNPGLRWGSNLHTAYVNESHYEADPVELNTVRPLSLLQKLLDKMFAGREDICVMGHIDDGDSILPRTLLVAAESIRRISTNKIYSSFTDFCDFMESVYGYVYTLQDVGYYMDRELSQLDRGEITRISHIRLSYLTSRTMNPTSTSGYYRMLPIGGIISEDLGDDLDMATEYEYEWAPGHGVNFMEEVFYNEYANTFVVQDYDTGKFYANFTRRDAMTQGDWYNDEDGHAREMIGLNISTFIDHAGQHMYAIIRNGGIVLCDKMHSSGWLDSKENNDSVVNLIFHHRRDIFKSSVAKSLKNVNNLSYRLDESKVYSDVEVGYKKQDYDNNNSAQNEFNFTNYYKTDCDITEQTLSLVCPYRADCYGIEELLVKRDSDESTDSDNDVFIVIASASEPIDGHWQIDRSITVENAYTNTVFNAAIAPNIIIRNNEEYLGVCARRLKFTSSDGNSSARIGNKGMSANINLTRQLFKVGIISIDSDDHDFPKDWDGVIEFEYLGKTYQGYLDSIEINIASLGTITYNIIEKCIE